MAGVGAGGVVALRIDVLHSRRLRAAGVAVATAYTFMLVRLAGPVALIAAPIFPFTSPRAGRPPLGVEGLPRRGGPTVSG